MNAPPELRFLWHSHSRDTFSGYGLTLSPLHLVGLLMVDRPQPVDSHWLSVLERVFGAYELTAMTQGGERGIVCQMHIAEESSAYLKTLDSSLTRELRTILLPLLQDLPSVTLALAWSPGRRCWVSQIVEPNASLFPLGQVVATPGAMRALERAEQLPAEFLNRHVRGDWGELDEEDKQENGFSVQYGYRIMSAYTTSAGDKLWLITEADRSVTTFLLPEEY